jgi:hypothetical protein
VEVNLLSLHNLVSVDAETFIPLLNRTTVTVDMEPPIVGVGDSLDKKNSEKLAALSAVFQLHDLGLVCYLVLSVLGHLFTAMHSWIIRRNCSRKLVTTPRSRSQIPL